MRSPGDLQQRSARVQLDRHRGVVLEEVDRLAHVGVRLRPRLGALADLERGELEAALPQPGGCSREREGTIAGADAAPLPEPLLRHGQRVGGVTFARRAGDRDDPVRFAWITGTELIAAPGIGPDRNGHRQRQLRIELVKRTHQLRAYRRAAKLEHRLVGECGKRAYATRRYNDRTPRVRHMSTGAPSVCIRRYVRLERAPES